MKTVQTGIDALLSGSANGGGDNEDNRAVLLDELKANLRKFGKELLEHLDHEEHSFATPVARKVSQSRFISKSGILLFVVVFVCFCLFSFWLVITTKTHVF